MTLVSKEWLADVTLAHPTNDVPLSSIPVKKLRSRPALGHAALHGLLFAFQNESSNIPSEASGGMTLGIALIE
jgi:hypothetical protein